MKKKKKKKARRRKKDLLPRIFLNYKVHSIRNAPFFRQIYKNKKINNKKIYL
jgi:hypothetical protein